MRIDPIGGENPVRLLFAEHARKLRAGFERMLQLPIRQAEVASPIDSQNRRSRGRLLRSQLDRAVGGRLAAGQIEHADPLSGGQQIANRPPHPQFGVVGVGSDDEDVEHDICIVKRGPDKCAYRCLDSTTRQSRCNPR